MTALGVEALKAALRRSIPLIVGLAVLGVIAVNLFQQSRGANYEATSRVLISTPLSSIITGTQPSFVDPDRVQQTAVGIAGSQQVYLIAERDTAGDLGDAGDLRSATSVVADPNTDLIAFTGSSSEPDIAVARANAVANGYIAYRQRLTEDQIDSTIEGLRTGLRQLPADSPERAELQAQLNQLLVLAENSGDAQLVQEATSAGKTNPAPLRDSMLGLSIGLVIALALVAIREAIDTTVRSEVDVEDLLEVPVLASVRSLPRRARMVTYGRHEADFADSYALLASQLALPRKAEDEAVVVAVTSSVSGEGKTTTATNLAVAAARRGGAVLLADFDFRKPAIDEVFGLPRGTQGARQVMSGTRPLDSSLWTATLHGIRPRLSQNGIPAREAEASVAGSLRVLAAGGSSSGAPPQGELSALLENLRSRANLVILDTPPALLTVEMAELARLIDVVIIVVRQGKASARNLTALRRQTRGWSADIAGAVLTDVPAEGGYSYYGGR